jgi:hypothetical protein
VPVVIEIDQMIIGAKIKVVISTKGRKFRPTLGNP